MCAGLHVHASACCSLRTHTHTHTHTHARARAHVTINLAVQSKDRTGAFKLSEYGGADYDLLLSVAMLFAAWAVGRTVYDAAAFFFPTLLTVCRVNDMLECRTCSPCLN